MANTEQIPQEEAPPQAASYVYGLGFIVGTAMQAVGAGKLTAEIFARQEELVSYSTATLTAGIGVAAVSAVLNHRHSS